VLAKVLAAIEDHGQEPVAEAVSSALRDGRCDLLALQRLAARVPEQVEVPVSLRGFEIERREARAYDALLAGGRP
jgi:hypothetical protein